MYNKILRSLAIPVLMAGSVFAQDQSMPFDAAVRAGKLPNGFTYYIRHNEEPKNRVVMYLANKVGSVLEDDDQQGLAHFMEHMNFNGLKHFPHNELVNYLQKNGVRFGADINAYTNFDETVFQLPLPSDNPEILKNGFQIMRDWAQDALLDSGEINKERGVVLEEKRLGKGASERMRKQYFPVILNNSRYAYRIPIGLDTILTNFKPETIRRFYHDWYRPDLQALIVVGDINVDEIEQTITAKFGDLKNPENERPRIKYTAPLTGKNQFITVTDREQTSTVLEVMINQPGRVVQTTDDFTNNLVKILYNGMLTERFADISRGGGAPFLKGSAGVNGSVGGLENFDVSVVAKPGELEKGFKAVWREVEKTKRFGFTAAELERMKQNILNNAELQLKEKDKTNSDKYVQQYLQAFLRGSVVTGIDYEFDLAKQTLAEISLKEVNELAKSEIKDSDRTVLIMAPEKEKEALPDEAAVNSWLKAINQEDLMPYVDKKISTKPLLVGTPIPGKIRKEQQNTQLGITTIKLTNGVKVILKPTNFKNEQVIFTAFAPGGTSLANDADYQSAANAAIIISAAGVGNYNTDDLNKYLKARQVAVKPYINERFQGVNGSSNPANLETAMQMIYACFTEPRKDSVLFKGIIARSKASLTNRANDPASVFNDTVAAVLGNYNVRRTAPDLQKLSQINLDKAYQFYKERFADASNFTFTFVGNIDTVLIKPLLEKYLGSLPSIYKHEKAKNLGIHSPDGKLLKTIYKGEEPKSTVMLVYSGAYGYSPENNIMMNALKETLEIRLLERLREEESGVYSPGISESVTKFPKQRYSFNIHFGCAPQNVDKLIASTLDEIDKLRTDGPPQDNLDKWRAEDKVSMKTLLTTNDFWLKYLNNQLQNNAGLSEIANYSKHLDTVKPQDVKIMAAKYLSGENYIQLVLNPDR